MMNFGTKNKSKSKPRNKLGLDMGSSSIKMVEISSTDSTHELICLGLKNVSSSVREPLIEAIKSLAEEIKVKTTEVNISVSGPSVIVRFISMPKMREDELKSAIRFEAEKHVPFAINDCIVDYQILKKHDKEGRFDILLVAVKKDFILDKVALIEESGFTVSAVDVDTFAVANACWKNFPLTDTNKTTALLNIGASFANVGIVRDGVLFFVRDVVLDGKSLSQGASKAALNNLLEEIKLSFSYYENQSGMGVDEIYVSGGGSNLDNLGGILEEAFESKPKFWDPLQFLDKSKCSAGPDLINKMKGSFAVAAGLALR